MTRLNPRKHDDTFRQICTYLFTFYSSLVDKKKRTKPSTDEIYIMYKLLTPLLLGLGLFSTSANAQPLSECLRTSPGIIAALGQATNLVRHTKGRKNLYLDERLSQVAQHHACDLAARNAISHTDAKGRTPMKRLRKTGFPACFSAENVAWGTKHASPTIAAWQQSPSHRVNQESPKATLMGFGQARGADGRLYWVGLYATPCKKRG